MPALAWATTWSTNCVVSANEVKLTPEPLKPLRILLRMSAVSWVVDSWSDRKTRFPPPPLPPLPPELQALIRPPAAAAKPAPATAPSRSTERREIRPSRPRAEPPSMPRLRR